MKLTVAQEKALQAVARGEVTHYERIRINSAGRSVFGYRTDIIMQLVNASLITLPSYLKPGTSTKYILTPAGREALEQVRCKK